MRDDTNIVEMCTVDMLFMIRLAENVDSSDNFF